MADDEMLVCRCEEITEEEIRQAIRMGADSVTAVKRMTRAGMGLCQGRTCGVLITRILEEETGIGRAFLVPDSSRPPVRPVTFGEMCGGDDAANG